MTDQLRDRLREEMSGQQRPPVDGLVAGAVDRARHTRRVRRSASGLGTVGVVGLTVLAVTIGSQLTSRPASSPSIQAGSPAASPAAATPAAVTTTAAAAVTTAAPAPTSAAATSEDPVQAVLDIKVKAQKAYAESRRAATAEQPPTWAAPPPGVKATTGGILQLLTTQLAAFGPTSHYGVTSDDPNHVQVYVKTSAGLSMVRVSLYKDVMGKAADCTKPPASLGSGPVCSTDAQGDLVIAWPSTSDESVSVVHPDGSGVQFDLYTWLAWDGTQNKQAPRALTIDQAAKLGADPRWDLSMDPALVTAGATNFPNPPTFG
jgi:hypothetical protein